MTDPVVHIQVDPTDSPSTPSWFGEVAVVAHALQRYGVLDSIQERVRLVRARMGKYELIDFAAMLIGYAVSGEPTLRAFCERAQPFASAFMALFGRADFPTPPTLSRLCAPLLPASSLDSLVRRPDQSGDEEQARRPFAATHVGGP